MLPTAPIVNSAGGKCDCSRKRVRETGQVAAAPTGGPRDPQCRAGARVVPEKNQDRSRTGLGIRLAGALCGNCEAGFVEEGDEEIRIAAGQGHVQDVRHLPTRPALIYIYVRNRSREAGNEIRPGGLGRDAKRIAAGRGLT